MHGIPLPSHPYHSAEWYEARRQSLGASEVAAALGFSSYQSTYSLWAEKTGRLPGDHRDETDQMRWGKVLEPVILDEFERLTGLTAYSREMSWRHPDIEWATASPDALATESEYAAALGIVEAKSAFMPWHPKGEEPAGEHVPAEYSLQAHWQMWVCGLDRAWIPLFAVGKRQLYVYELERDERLIEVAVDAARQFWHYVETDTEPPVDAHEATGRALAAVHSGPADVAVELDRDTADALTELRQLKLRMKPLDERRAYLENVVKKSLGDATTGTIAGAAAVTWKEQTSRRIDTKALREEMPEVAEKFTTESAYRVLRPKEIK